MSTNLRWAMAALLLQSFAISHAGPITIDRGWQLQDIAKVPDSGANLSMPNYRPKAWLKATVPGTVLTSLVNDGVYPEPFYGENNYVDKIPESLCHTSYWYRTTVAVPESFAGKHIWLQFEGINYAAEVWVNGSNVGEIKGAFTRGTFDISKFAKGGQTVGLAVKIDPQPHAGEPHQKTQASGTGRNGGDTARDGATFLASIGWDWIPTIRDRNTGIWQKVTLSATEAVQIRDPYVSAEIPLPRTDSADLTIQTTLVNVSDKEVVGYLTGTAKRLSTEGSLIPSLTREEPISFGYPLSISAHGKRTVTMNAASAPELHVKNPHLWWPNGYGAPTLYNLHLTFSTAHGDSDTKDVSFGIRKLTYTLPGSDNLAISVNGVPVLCKGGDWGMDEGMKRIGRKRLEAQVRFHKEANYTMIRNWVGQSTSEDLYDLCDRYGILVWDEFFQPNPYDGPNPDDVELYLANVREKILRFRNHPSIALWCARNEGAPPEKIHLGIDALNNELDGKRLYQPSSTDGRGVRSGGPYRWREPRAYYVFDEAFKTEIGSMSIPTLQGLHAMMPVIDWGTINDDWAEHDFAKGAQASDDYLKKMTSRYGPISGTPDLVRKGQLMNYEAYRAMYEGRNARLFKPVTGVITWMSNPSQPSFVWQLYSHDLEPLSSLFAVRKACEPIHIQVDQNNWHVSIINNTPQTFEGSMAVGIYNMDGSLVSRAAPKITAGPCAATDTGRMQRTASTEGLQFVVVELRDSNEKVVSSNFYWMNADETHEDDFTALNTLPVVSLEASASRRDVGSRVFLTVNLKNPANKVALMAHLQLRKSKSDDRVLPVYYSDNYVSFLPGENKTITIECAREDLGGSTPVVAVDGWNIAPPLDKKGGVAVVAG